MTYWRDKALATVVERASAYSEGWRAYWGMATSCKYVIN